jgi:hypothetical protein
MKSHVCLAKIIHNPGRDRLYIKKHVDWLSKTHTVTEVDLNPSQALNNNPMDEKQSDALQTIINDFGDKVDSPHVIIWIDFNVTFSGKNVSPIASLYEIFEKIVRDKFPGQEPHIELFLCGAGGSFYPYTKETHTTKFKTKKWEWAKDKDGYDVSITLDWTKQAKDKEQKDDTGIYIDDAVALYEDRFSCRKGTKVLELITPKQKKPANLRSFSGEPSQSALSPGGSRVGATLPLEVNSPLSAFSDMNSPVSTRSMSSLSSVSSSLTNTPSASPKREEEWKRTQVDMLRALAMPLSFSRSGPASLGDTSTSTPKSIEIILRGVAEPIKEEPEQETQETHSNPDESLQKPMLVAPVFTQQKLLSRQSALAHVSGDQAPTIGAVATEVQALTL